MKIVKAIDEKYLSQIVSFQLLMALETEDYQLDKDILTQGVKEVLKNPTRGCYYLALESDKLIGMLLTIPEWSDWRAKEVLWIHSVYVEKDYRGKGIFQNLYQHIKSIVESNDKYAGIRLYVDKTNQSAIEVYQKIGMSDEHYQLFEWLK